MKKTEKKKSVYYIFLLSMIFIGMEKKNMTISIRLSENQMRSLCESLLFEKKNKSTVIREIIDDYTQKICHKQDLMEKIENRQDNVDSSYSTRNKLKNKNIE